MGRSPKLFEPASLLPYLAALNCRGKLFVAFSGGADSTALLSALSDIRSESGLTPHAVHVNHDAQEHALDWEAHCAQIAAELDLPFTSAPPPDDLASASGSEDRWRRMRLGAFETLLDAQDVVCTAHHQEDQAETLLLNLFRGSGVDGWAAIPSCRPLGRGRLVRPLLGVSRRALRTYLKNTGLSWIEDPSNEDLAFDRNYLRNEVLPKLQSRWPAVHRTLSQTTEYAAEARQLIESEMEQRITRREIKAGVLDIKGLEGDVVLLKHLIKVWLRSHGTAPLPGARLVDFVSQIAQGKTDSKACVSWEEHDLRCHRLELWLQEPVSLEKYPATLWGGENPINLGEFAGNYGLARGARLADFRVQCRIGGETYSRAPGQPSQSLKEWFRQSELPPWFRDSVPLLYEQSNLVAIGDHPVCNAFLQHLAQHDNQVIWRPGNQLLDYAWRRCSRRMQRVK